MDRDERPQRRRRGSRNAGRQYFLQARQCAIHTFLRRILGYAQRLSHIANGFVLKKPERNGVAVRCFESRQRFIQIRCVCIPQRIWDFPGGCCGGSLAHGLPFVMPPAGRTLMRIAADIPCGLQQPAGHRAAYFRKFLVKQNEHRLRDIFGRGRVAHLPPGGGVDQIHILANQIRKGWWIGGTN